MYRLVIFDFDGTLADSAPWFLGALDSLSVRHGFRRVSPEEIEMLRGRSTREVMAAMGVSPWRLPFIAADLRRRMAEDVHQIRLFPGAEEMLTALRAGGARLAVVSSNSEANVRSVLGAELCGVIDAFGCGVGLLGKGRRFKQLLDRQGVAPGHALCVGDELRDIEAAQSIGADSGAVLWGYATPDALRAGGATHVFDRFDQIPPLVLGY